MHVNDIARPLSVEAEGYITYRQELNSGELESLSIRLATKEGVSCMIVDEMGNPEADVSILLVARPSGGMPIGASDWATEICRSDSQGEFTLPRSGDDVYYAALGGRASRPFMATEEPAGGAKSIELPLGDASRFSLAGHVLDGSFEFRLESSGQFVLPDLRLRHDTWAEENFTLPLGSYVIYSVDHGVIFDREASRKLLLSAARALGYTQYSTPLTVDPDNGLTEINLVQADAPLIQVVDESGQPVAPFEIWDEVETASQLGMPSKGDWRRRNPLERIVSNSHSMSLARFKLKRISNNSYRLAICAEGYLTSYVTRRPNENLKVALVRDTTALTLKVEDRAIKTGTCRYQLRYRSNGEVCHDGLAGPESPLLGPFISRGQRQFTLWRFQAGDFAQVAEVEFAEGRLASTVVVAGGGVVKLSGPNLQRSDFSLRDSMGRRYIASQTASGLLFSRVPAGEYALVGRWQDSAFSSMRADVALGLDGITSGELYSIAVEDGGVTEVHLSGGSLPTNYEGEVSITRECSLELFVYPLFAGEALPRRANPGGGMMAVPSSGRYSFKGMAPEPSKIVLCRLDDLGLLVPLVSAPAGGDLSVSGASISVIAGECPWHCAHVQYTFEGRKRSAAACANESGVSQLGWFPAGTVTVFFTDRTGRTGQAAVEIPAKDHLTLELTESEMYPQSQRPSQAPTQMTK